MGRGLSPQQRTILATLARVAEPIPIVDLAEIFWQAYPDKDEQERRLRAGEAETFGRDRLFACRRAIDALERRGLVRVVYTEIEWSRQSPTGLLTTKTETVLAAEPLPEPENLPKPAGNDR